MNKWQRHGYGQQKLVNEIGEEVGCVLKMQNCRYWYPYLFGADEPDGERFDTAREAKAYVEREVKRDKHNRW